jgi:shikimate 5-dehydrogenase
MIQIVGINEDSTAEESIQKETYLLQQMISKQSKGWVIVDGLDVFIEQGRAQFELFTKRPAPKHVMRRAVQESHVNRNHK